MNKQAVRLFAQRMKFRRAIVKATEYELLSLKEEVEREIKRRSKTK